MIGGGGGRFGFHIPKGYLYATIGFSVMIGRSTSWLLQRRRFLSANHTLRQRTTEGRDAAD